MYLLDRFKMKNLKNTLILSFLLGAVLFAVLSCDRGQSSSATKKTPQVSMETIKLNLEADMIADRQEPFIPRKFDPYLNGKWIGNAISYGCYREGQAPGVEGPSEAEILEDLNILKEHWNLIRGIRIRCGFRKGLEGHPGKQLAHESHARRLSGKRNEAPRKKGGKHRTGAQSH